MANMLNQVNSENLKNVQKISDDDFAKIREKFYIRIRNLTENIQIHEKNKNFKELQNEIEIFKKFIYDYNLKYLINMRNDQILIFKKLIGSYENKLNSFKCLSLINEKKSIIAKKMSEKYLERKNNNEFNFNEDYIFSNSKNEKENSTKKITDNVVDTCTNILRYYEMYKQNTKDNIRLQTSPLNTNYNSNIIVNNKDNKQLNLNVQNFNTNKNKLVNNNPCDFNIIPNINVSNMNNINLMESYLFFDKYQKNNNNILPNGNISNNEKLNLEENIQKYIDDIKLIKNHCSGMVKFMKDDPLYLKNLENDIAILKVEILKEYPKYQKWKKLIKNVIEKYKK